MKKHIQRWGVVGALVASVSVVCCIRSFDWVDSSFTCIFIQICELMGKIFMNGLKMLVVPLITSSIICGIMGFGSQTEFRRLGLKTFLFYFLSCLKVSSFRDFCSIFLLAPNMCVLSHI